MGLDFEYFKDQTFISDLHKLNENELCFIIRSLQDELEGFQPKELIKACNKVFDLFKDLRFILNGYIDVMKENDIVRKNNLPFCNKAGAEDLINIMDSITDILKTIGVSKTSKNKVNDMVNTVIFKLRVLYGSINEYFYVENHIWNFKRCEQEELNNHKQE